MNIRDVKNILTEGGIDSNEAKIEAQMLCEHFLGRSNVDLIMNADFDENSQEGLALLRSAKERAQTRKPIQHIIGAAYFMGEYFIVNEHVLIPRDETEILVRKAVDRIYGRKARSQEGKSGSKPALVPSSLLVLDIGTGSGCIACIVAKLTQAKILGVDISDNALEVARKNAQKLGVSNKVRFKKSDLFSDIDEKFDLIVSNPPYIPISEKENLQREVKFDPENALFATDEQGIEFYDKIIKKAPNFLNKNGSLLFELGIGQAQSVKNLMKEAGFKNIEAERDLGGLERIITGDI